MSKSFAMRSSASFALIASIGIVLFGCAKSEPKGTAPSTSTPSVKKEGWTEIDSAGFKVSVPEGWQAIDLTAADIDKIFSEAAKESPALKAAEAQIRQAASSGMIKLMAFHPKEGETDFVENMNVVVTDIPAGVTVKQIEEAYRQQIKPMSMPDSTITGEAVDLPVGPAMRMQSKLNMQPGANKYVASLAYMFAYGTKSYTITFSSKPARESEIVKEADEIMSTFRIQ